MKSLSQVYVFFPYVPINAYMRRWAVRRPKLVTLEISVLCMMVFRINTYIIWELLWKALLPLTSKQTKPQYKILKSYVQCITFILPYINQHLCTTLCIINHVLVTNLTRFGVYWHHLQGAQYNCIFVATRQMVTNTYTFCLQPFDVMRRIYADMWFSIHSVVHKCWLIKCYIFKLKCSYPCTNITISNKAWRMNTHILLRMSLLALYHSNMFQPPKIHPQGVHFSSKVNKMSYEM
jgi:hypothetical protein